MPLQLLKSLQEESRPPSWLKVLLEQKSRTGRMSMPASTPLPPIAAAGGLSGPAAVGPSVFRPPSVKNAPSVKPPKLPVPPPKPSADASPQEIEAWKKQMKVYIADLRRIREHENEFLKKWRGAKKPSFVHRVFGGPTWRAWLNANRDPWYSQHLGIITNVDAAIAEAEGLLGQYEEQKRAQKQAEEAQRQVEGARQEILGRMYGGGPSTAPPQAAPPVPVPQTPRNMPSEQPQTAPSGPQVPQPSPPVPMAPGPAQAPPEASPAGWQPVPGARTSLPGSPTPFEVNMRRIGANPLIASFYRPGPSPKQPIVSAPGFEDITDPGKLAVELTSRSGFLPNRIILGLIRDIIANPTTDTTSLEQGLLMGYVTPEQANSLRSLIESRLGTPGAKVKELRGLISDLQQYEKAAAQLQEKMYGDPLKWAKFYADVQDKRRELAEKIQKAVGGDSALGKLITRFRTDPDGLYREDPQKYALAQTLDTFMTARTVSGEREKEVSKMLNDAVRALGSEGYGELDENAQQAINEWGAMVAGRLRRLGRDADATLLEYAINHPQALPNLIRFNPDTGKYEFQPEVAGEFPGETPGTVFGKIYRSQNAGMVPLRDPRTGEVRMVPESALDYIEGSDRDREMTPQEMQFFYMPQAPYAHR